MNPLSRAARESVTTTRKNGRFFDPARRKRITTMGLSCTRSRGSTLGIDGYAARETRPSSTGLTPVAQHLHRPTAGALTPTGQPAERFQHLLHLHELLQQTIHFFYRRSAALRDPPAPAAVDDVLLPALVRRHRPD